MKLVSFSGIDGAGKSTQLCALQVRLAQAGLKVTPLSFWDDVAVFARFREFASHAVFKGDKGVGTPEHPINRRDKNVQNWQLMLMRYVLYLLDALKLRIVVAKAQVSGTDVLVFDRYIYDELANLPLRHWIARAYSSFLLKLSRKPDIPYLIDAEPDVVCIRKPEYPVDFLRWNREAFLRLSELAGGMTIIEPLPAADVRERVLREASRKLLQDFAPATASSVGT